MRILHVSLANPYYHHGGLNRYCKDLMDEQKKKGHEVFLLFPGKFITSRKPRIKQVSDSLYTMNDCLPVPLTYGIDIPSRYMVSTDSDCFERFLDKIKPDIIHVHSIMGFHKEFFESCKRKKIQMIFTTHDYYPICFKCNLIDNQNNICMDKFDYKKCFECNRGCGLNKIKQIVIQSNLYQKTKDLPIYEFIKRHSISSLINRKEIIEANENHNKGDFSLLHNYYGEILSLIENIHCNSNLSKSLYMNIYPSLNYRTIPITHSGIKTKQHIRKRRDKLSISFFGGASQRKGYNTLLDVLKYMPNNETWEINMYGGPYPTKIYDSRIQYRGFFRERDEDSVWDNTDLLIFLSICPESFGFGVLEALSAGIPVVCSDLIGAAYLLNGIDECCYKRGISAEEISKKIIEFINYDKYIKIQKKVLNTKIDSEMSKHCDKMLNYYNEVVL